MEISPFFGKLLSCCRFVYSSPTTTKTFDGIGAKSFNVLFQHNLAFFQRNAQLLFHSFGNFFGSDGTEQFAIDAGFGGQLHSLAINGRLLLFGCFLFFGQTIGLGRLAVFQFIHGAGIGGDGQASFQQKIAGIPIGYFYQFALFTGSFYILLQYYFHASFPPLGFSS